MRTICFDLYHDGVRWIAKNDQIVVTGKTLEELDENLKLKLKDVFENERTVKVNMELDYRKMIPHWMWQYHPYYFYRTVYLEMD
jgi:hypothetical protein